MLSEHQIRTIEAIIGVFETGRIAGSDRYGMVTLIPGDSGGLTYGKHQTTINSGNLYLLIKAYCEDTGSDFRAEFAPYMTRLIAKDQALGTDADFKALLRKAGSDPDMQETQDAFFRRVYWNPAYQEAKNLGLARIVSYAIVYDSFVHGSWRKIRDKVNENIGSAHEVGEIQWIKAYNSTRKNWLEFNPNPVLRKTIYRQVAFDLILSGDNWDLQLPFKVRGVNLTAAALGIESGDYEVQEVPVDRASVEEEADRLLMLTNPPMAGDDVLEVKNALVSFFYPITEGNEYDTVLVESVRLFQQTASLRVDGIVGPATRRALGL